MEKKIGVLGAGLSGLVSAFTLEKHSFNSDVLEVSLQTGGKLGSFIHPDGWLVEAGAATFFYSKGVFSHLLDELTLDSIKPNPEAALRYLVKRQRMEAAPSSPRQLLTTRLLSTLEKLTVASEPFIPTCTNSANESVLEFFSRRCGRAVSEQFVAPLVSGIYAGSAAELSMVATFPELVRFELENGSLFSGLRAAKRKSPKIKREIRSFAGGLVSLINALSHRLPSIKLGAEVHSISFLNPGWKVLLKNEESFHYNAIISTLPLPTLKAIKWEGLSEVINEKLNQLPLLPYAPLAVVALGYAESQFAQVPKGFGVLIPPRENLPVLGIQFSSSAFAGRAPAGHVLLTAFVGGRLRPELASQPDDILIKSVNETVKLLLGVKGAPVFHQIIRWPEAIPQYTSSYFPLNKALDEIEAAIPTLAFAGNYRAGVSVPDVATHSTATAERLAAHMGI